MSQAVAPVVINMAELEVTSNSKKKKQDSLFGPNIGVVSSGPDWTNVNQKKVIEDQLTPEIIQNWISRSKEPSQPTTTLQALVNLKRPTLRLSPLTLAPTDDPTHVESHHHHGLEFEYDCDAPKCGIYVHVLLNPDQVDPATGSSRVLVFETVVQGGFGKILSLEEGAMLELGRFEHIAHEPMPVPATRSTPEEPPSEVASTAAATTGDSSTLAGRPDRRRRFTNLHFRKLRSHANRAVSGPALAVVDVEPATTDALAKGKTDDHSKNDDEGVKVIIRLAALDEQGSELASPNEQITYLHVVRFGKQAENEVENKEGDADAEVEDTRPWIVKVVKREATIGPHTFHLHEIYGLASQSAHTQTLPTPTPLPASPDQHSYPPPATPAPPAEDEPSSECLLCLSSPREVVLLPCRHLVACKECALNMVEFGAGGNIIQPTDEAVPTPDAAAVEGEADGAAEGTAGNTSAAPASATVPAPVVAQPARRKRKAKGWFCPVCRQPYTSLLRITTTPPKASDLDHESTASHTERPASASVTVPSPALSRPPSSGRLGSFRPAFMRTISRPAPQPDLERGV